MKCIYKILAYATSAIALVGCAKAVSEGVNVANKRYFDAWMSINHPDVSPSGLGIYVLEEETGTGAEVKKDGFAIVSYTATDLEGNISAYTDKEVAKQLCVYDTTLYYGPQVWTTYDETIQAGLQNAIVGMKVGGRKKVIIPSWLMTYSSYGSAKEYLNHASDYSNAIYDFTIQDFTDSIDVWQQDSIERYIIKDYGSLDTFRNDTTGFYYRSLETVPESAKEFPSDTSIYINYTGKLLNGLVFDTTYERVAKDNGLYDASKTYEPVRINWAASFSDLAMGTVDESSSVISGFAMTLWRLRYDPDNDDWKDKCIGIFTSQLGYGYSGSGSSIPGYSPLIFEIEIVSDPTE